MTTTITRFAPSPTGLLHVGNMRTAIYNWLFAHRHGGSMILRLDDTDPERSSEEFAEAIRRDLLWMGLAPDREERQSVRSGAYEGGFETLRRGGRVYPCYETAEELDRQRASARARRKPPVYDRAALRLSDDERKSLEAEGRQPHWRFKLSGQSVGWNDLVRGDCSVQTAALSDPVVRRADGRWLYMLPSAVDDVEFGVSHVIRGEDHVANTAVQIEIIRALDGEIPEFAHHPLLVDADGEPLSKRLKGLSVSALREQGVEPIALANSLASLHRFFTVKKGYVLSRGTDNELYVFGKLVRDINELVEKFSLDALGRTPQRFDEKNLWKTNGQILREMSFVEVRERLAVMEVGGGEEFWLAVRENLARLSDACDWWQVVGGTVESVVEEAEFAELACGLLPAEPWDAATWGAWTAALAERTGRRGRALYRPLRLALTGRDDGPEMKALLPLIGYERAVGRLSGR